MKIFRFFPRVLRSVSWVLYLLFPYNLNEPRVQWVSLAVFNSSQYPIAEKLENQCSVCGQVEMAALYTVQ